jgi:hypothetical protein
MNKMIYVPVKKEVWAANMKKKKTKVIKRSRCKTHFGQMGTNSR